MTKNGKRCVIMKGCSVEREEHKGGQTGPKVVARERSYSPNSQSSISSAIPLEEYRQSLLFPGWIFDPEVLYQGSFEAIGRGRSGGDDLP